MVTENYLALDLGAGSGRAILGRFDGDRLLLEELHRFPNDGVRVHGHLHWDVLRLFSEMKAGLAKAASHTPVSLGVDTWGVDFALLDSSGALVGNPYCYRDARTNGVMEQAFAEVSREDIFNVTGLQFMEFNTLFQLYSMKGAPSKGGSALDSARTLLMMPDLFHYWFSGRPVCEYTDASTSQCLDPRRRAWATDLLSRLGLPTGILPEIVPPGTQLGELLPDVAGECGVGSIGPGKMQIVVPASHDTASAVAAIPGRGDDWAYLSSGTWSLLGCETAEPLVTPAVLDRNFTNEGGAWGKTRLLKNICGLWLLEECRREWSRQGIDTSYDELCRAAEAAEPFRSVIDVDDPAFVPPGDMPARIAGHCARHGQPAPGTPGQFARCIFEGLALKYRLVLADLQQITGTAIRKLHIVGGGSKNALLCQYAADATGLAVEAGPVEATALGNVLLQAVASGRLTSSTEARDLVRRSVQLTSYEPTGEHDPWQQAADRLQTRTES